MKRLYFSWNLNEYDNLYIDKVGYDLSKFDENEPVCYVDLNDDELFNASNLSFNYDTDEVYDYKTGKIYPYWQGKVYRHCCIEDDFISETISGEELHIWEYCESHNIEGEIETYDIYKDGKLIFSDFKERCDKAYDELSKVFKKYFP